jgi:hypothetical protein
MNSAAVTSWKRGARRCADVFDVLETFPRVSMGNLKASLWEAIEFVRTD